MNERRVRIPIDGVLVGHHTDDDASTGCTVVLFPAESVASGAVLLGTLTHRQWWPVVPFIVGLALFFASHAAVEEHSAVGISFAILGSAFILVAHWLNFRASRAFGSCSLHAHSA